MHESAISNQEIDRKACSVRYEVSATKTRMRKQLGGALLFAVMCTVASCLTVVFLVILVKEGGIDILLWALFQAALSVAARFCCMRFIKNFVGSNEHLMDVKLELMKLEAR